jgi:MFS family permease
MARCAVGHATGRRAASGAGTNPWLIAIVVALASFMEVLDTTIANVALPYIAGGMGVSEDEASWVVTTYLVSNAIILNLTGCDRTPTVAAVIAGDLAAYGARCCFGLLGTANFKISHASAPKGGVQYFSC